MTQFRTRVLKPGRAIAATDQDPSNWLVEPHGLYIQCNLRCYSEILKA